MLTTHMYMFSVSFASEFLLQLARSTLFFLELGIAVSRGREQLFYGKVSLEDSGRQRYVACVH